MWRLPVSLARVDALGWSTVMRSEGATPGRSWARFWVIAALCAGLAFGAGRARAATGTFGSAGVEQTFIVPQGVEVLRAVAVGGRGYWFPGGAAGGFGAVASADIPVTAGELLYVDVGGDGAPGDGGFNGGGSGGTFGSGGGGGGASDVRTVPASAPASFASRLIVAGGGGGAGDDPTGVGGAGGAAGAPGNGRMIRSVRSEVGRAHSRWAALAASEDLMVGQGLSG